MEAKLVRDHIPDHIPDIIHAQGNVPVTRTATDEEYLRLLREKLSEEITEFFDADAPEKRREELADILQVVHAMGHEIGLSPADLEELRLEKSLRNGGFDTRTILLNIQPGNSDDTC